MKSYGHTEITEITERVIEHTDLTDPTDFFWVAFGSKSEENLINKNLENPFDLVETASLMLCLHASAFEQARSLSLQTYHQSVSVRILVQNLHILSENEDFKSL